MDRRIFLNLLPAAGALFGLKAKGAPVPAQQTYLQWRAARERLRMSAAAIQKQRAADLAFVALLERARKRYALAVDAEREVRLESDRRFGLLRWRSMAG